MVDLPCPEAKERFDVSFENACSNTGRVMAGRGDSANWQSQIKTADCSILRKHERGALYPQACWMWLAPSPA